LLVGPAVYRALAGFRFNLIRRGNEVAFQLVFMLLLTVGAALLGVTPMFGAFMAGIIVGTAGGATGREERASINAFSFAFFIPIYFAMVGLKLDLVHAFSPVFFLIFLAIACAAKFGAVWIGARVAGESTPASTNLGVALNARGGPGIVLASTAFAAGIVDESFYAVLVMLAIVTSLIAGSWLGAVVRRGEPLRGRRLDSGTEGRPLGRPAAREEKRR
jgi:Kef-type K+ transport system membrane component KefB